ncbi:arabinogalactan oligomer/maltooligosaccharide transport system substrate-binding protein [Pullulanibacillus pueri]|uniref:Maltodextrin-binding protein n=1 Tax=Pullulanibacillus pueri TaxID=1437324 RepID=A0A8J2ZVA8_9BACL|nr:maltose ABC transporter substrate-binding protein [Pullulanibacillus pueri]MBM7682073.1 arabinogalactan oligomer/maltooligosaccharide transport system substrate-binding protein [Pullulanibacillus pueri]GGH80085.1 maltose ABC transporter substrate-binding protein [Pullulanibacillus pueri]
MSRKGRLMGLIMVLILSIGSVLVGCSSDKDTSSKSGKSKSGVPTGQTITLWVWKGEPWLGTVKTIAQKWAKEHNDTVKIVDQSKQPNGFQFYATAARTGKGPDVVLGIPHDNLGLFHQEGLISEVPSDIDLNAYNDSVQRAVLVDGKPYAVPTTVETTAIVYNKKLVKEAPKTWDEFKAAADKNGFMYDQANLFNNYTFIGGLGGYVFKDNNGTYDPKDIGLGNEGAIKAYQLMYDMDNTYHWMTPSVDDNVAKSKFTSGAIGMYATGPWAIADLDKSKVDYSFAPFPTLSNGKAATPFETVQTTIVNARSKHQEAAWSLVQALNTKEAQMKYYSEDKQIPALKEAQEDSTVQSNENIKPFIEQLKTAVPQPNIPEMQAAYSAMSVMKNIISGKVTPEKGAKSFVDNIKKGIKVQNQ